MSESPQEKAMNSLLTAVKITLAKLVGQLSNFGKLVEDITQKVTIAVTSNIKTWMNETGPCLGRSPSPLKDVSRPPKFTRSIDLSEIAEDSVQSLPV